MGTFPAFLSFNSFRADTPVDLRAPVLRPIFRPVYPLAATIFMYTALCLLGIVGNLIVGCALNKRNFRHRRHQE